MKALRRTDEELDRLSKIRRRDVDEGRAYWKSKAKPKWRGLIEATRFKGK